MVVDFTVLDASRENLAWAAEHGVHAVVGTTGFTAEDHERLRALFTRSNCLIAPNFAIGAVLMMRFAELAAPWFETAEMIELHHDQQGRRAVGHGHADGASGWRPPPTGGATIPPARRCWPGARGGDGPGGIQVHSVRLRGLVAHQEVLLGHDRPVARRIRHDSYDRDSFMPGVVLAVKQVADHPGLTIGLDGFLGL